MDWESAVDGDSMSLMEAVTALGLGSQAANDPARMLWKAILCEHTRLRC